MARASNAGYDPDTLAALLLTRWQNHYEEIPHSVVVYFCQTDQRHVGEWLDGARKIEGIKAVKLWHLLEVATGYSQELSAIRASYPLGEYIGRLLAYNVITSDEAREVCGGVKNEAVIRAIRGQGTLLRPAKGIEDLQKEYGDIIEERTSALRRWLRGESLPKEPLRPVSDTNGSHEMLQSVSTNSEADEAQAPTAPAGSGDRMALINQLARQISDGGIAARIALEELTPDERTSLRKLLGDRGLFSISNALNNLAAGESHV